jgi:hypothetical protein
MYLTITKDFIDLSAGSEVAIREFEKSLIAKNNA